MMAAPCSRGKIQDLPIWERAINDGAEIFTWPEIRLHCSVMGVCLLSSSCHSRPLSRPAAESPEK